MPSGCPDCGGELEVESVADQFQTELPEIAPVVTRYRVQVGRCRSCKRRVQGRHPEQTSDALWGRRAPRWGIGPRHGPRGCTTASA
ncbi:MAG: IS66 family transposase zinc-finger binding domain-containing protein [Acidimicrobiales bacterium]